MSSDVGDELRAAYHTQINTTRTASMRALAQASGRDTISPKQMLWPVDESSDGKQRHLNAHTAVLRYRAELRPYRGEEEELWTDTVATVDAPHDDLPAAVALANAGEWERAFVERRRRTSSTVHGAETEVRQYRALLPVKVLRSLYDRLNDMLKAIQFAPTAESTTETGIGKELMEEVEQWRQKNVE